MFAPFTGYGLGLPFWETYFSSVAGGTFGAAIFYYASEVFMRYSLKKRKEKETNSEYLGYTFQVDHHVVLAEKHRLKFKF